MKRAIFARMGSRGWLRGLGGSVLISVLLGGLASGCQTVSSDPREGGLLGGMSGLQSGAYERRVQDREARLAEMRAVQQDLERDQGTLAQRYDTLSRQVAEDQTRLTRLNSEIAGLDRNIDQLATRHGSEDKRVQTLRTRVTELKRQASRQQSSLDALEGSGVGDADTELRRRQLEEQRNALQREYELLMQLSLELAR